MALSISFQTFFWTGIYTWCRLLKIQYVITIHLIRLLTNFYEQLHQQLEYSLLNLIVTAGEFKKCYPDERTL